ncbi:MAG: hypothetical protein M1824_006385 [Vezdaea acicularis]|nr:MAG: hypothetical protein M1824_006385 [Vezdaea acicularis]
MAPQVNGESPLLNSLFISHITSYPVISDTITTFKKNPYGQKSLSLADQGYATFAEPILPYFSKPYSIVSPYVAKADSIADKGLSKVDDTFPIVKTPTDQLKGTVTDYAYFPFKKAGETKDYLFSVYGAESKRAGPGLVNQGKATVSTGLTITSDIFGYLANYWDVAKDKTKETVDQNSK